MVSRSDLSILGCVTLDGSLKDNTKTDRVTQPLLMITGDYHDLIRKFEQSTKDEDRENAKRMSGYEEEYETLCHHSPNSYKQVIPDAEHMYFTDQPFRYYHPEDITAKKVSDAMRAHSTVSQEVLKFLGSCLSR